MQTKLDRDIVIVKDSCEVFGLLREVDNKPRKEFLAVARQKWVRLEDYQKLEAQINNQKPTEDK